jgi:hypothetical protein
MNIKLGVNEELEKILLEPFQQMHSENVPTSKPTSRQKATVITLCLKIENFKASNGWLHRYLK